MKVRKGKASKLDAFSIFVKMKKDYFSHLSPEEKNILKDKEQKPLLAESTMTFLKQEYLFVEHVNHPFMNPIQNLIQDVDGHLLMMN